MCWTPTGQLHCPPVCARFLLGGNCDKVLFSTVVVLLPTDVDELLAAILGAIAELLLEAFMELIAAAVLDLASRASLDVFTGLTDAIKENKILTGVMYGLLGVFAGVLSLLILPHRLIHREHPIGFHGISLLIRPDHRWVCAVIGWSRHAEVGKEGDSRRNLRVRFRIRARNGACPIPFRAVMGTAPTRAPSRSWRNSAPGNALDFSGPETGSAPPGRGGAHRASTF